MAIPKFTTFTSGAVPVEAENIDTDQIYPGRFLELTDHKQIGSHCFAGIDEAIAPGFPKGGIVVAGRNFGCGSSREHAALVPLYLGVKAVITKSFARIHVANLVNAGILPFTFANEEDYDKIDQMDELSLPNIKDAIENNKPVVLKNLTKGEEYQLNSSHLSARQRAMLVCGGLLDYTREMNK